MIGWQLLFFFQILLSGFFSLFQKKLSVKSDPFLVSLAVNMVPVPFLFLLTRGFPPLSFIWIFPLLSALFYSLGNILVFKAFSEGDVSMIAPLSTVRIVFVLIISVVVLSEALTIQKLIGVLLIFIGMGYLNKKQNLLESLKFLVKDRVAVLVLISALIFSFANVNDKNSLTYFDSFTYPFLIYGGISLFTSTYFIFNRKKLREFGNLIKEKWALTLGGSFCVSGAYIFFLFMALQTDVSIIVPLLNISIFISLFLGKYVLKEKIESRWLAAVLMVIGAALLMLPQYF